MKLMRTTYSQKLASINRRLRNGDVTEIASRSGYSVPYTSQVLNGQFVNEGIVDTAYAVTMGRQTTAKALANVLSMA